MKSFVTLSLWALPLALAVPFEQIAFQPASGTLKAQLDPDDGGHHTPNHPWTYKEHLSGISEYFESHGPTPHAPEGCKVVGVAVLARHSSITMNDDEWPDTLEPFVKKLKSYQKASKKGKKAKIPRDSPLHFLQKWKSPVKESNMEELTKPGARDAAKFGSQLHHLYADLLPKAKDRAFKIYTASSARDVESAMAFISGMFPRRKIGTKPGQVNLVKVPNKDAAWKSSLTPHKSCERFDKTAGKKERDDFQQIYCKSILEKLQPLVPELELVWTDVVAMQEFCGYETVIRGSSPFCEIFSKEEIEAFEYSQDLLYYNMMGGDSRWTAAMGVPWLQIAANKLNRTSAQPLHHKKLSADFLPTRISAQTSELPQPSNGPNATHSQPVHIWFTHREEIPVLTHALGLYTGNETEQPGSTDLPLDRVNPNRAWRTSNIIPFLGHVALERMQCTKHTDGDGDKGVDSQKKDSTHPYVRIIVNGSPQIHPECSNGPGRACPFDVFMDIVSKMPAKYGDIEEACKKQE